MKKQIVCLMALLGLMIGCTTSEEQYAGSQSAPNVGTKYSELPPAVQRTIQMRVPNGKIDDIDKETRSGRTIYEITFTDPGVNPKIHVAEDGALIIKESSGVQ